MLWKFRYNPYKYLVVTRILATTLMVPLLVICRWNWIVGGYVGINIHSDVNMFRYISQVLESITFLDIFPATIKTFSLAFL
jgi:phospholipid/cholesterol/gamma-HCH transport system permease protein